MAGPKNPEQLRGALGAIRRRLQEAETPKAPKAPIDIPVDTGLDPSKAPVPVTPRFQAPTVPEEPTAPSPYKGVEDIAERLINTPTDRRSFMRGTGQAINALKFMNSPLAKMIGKLPAQEAAPQILPHNQAMVAAFKDVLKSVDLPKLFPSDVSQLPLDAEGRYEHAAKFQGSAVSDALYRIAQAVASHHPGTRPGNPTVYEQSLSEKLSAYDKDELRKKFAQAYELYSGKPLEENFDNSHLFQSVFELRHQAEKAYGNLDSVYVSRPEDLKVALTRDGSQNRLEEWLEDLVERDITSFRLRHPEATREDIYNNYGDHGPLTPHGEYYETRQVLNEPTPEKLRALERKRGFFENFLTPERLQEQIDVFDSSKSIRDELFPQWRDRFDRVYDRLVKNGVLE